MDFEEHIGNHTRGRLVIAFAGGIQTHFQFGRSLRQLGVCHILFRDSTQHYYLNGIDGIGGRKEVIKYIVSWIDSGFYVMTTGVSSGSFGALLYGQLSGVHAMIPISPLTTRTSPEDFPEEVRGQIYDPAINVDLLPYFKNGPVATTRAFIGDMAGTELDRQMATRIGVEDVTVVHGAEHQDVGVYMRNRGMFADLFTGPIK